MFKMTSSVLILRSRLFSHVGLSSSSFKYARFMHKASFNELSIEIHRQCELFDLESKRQKEAVGRIEKIQVNYEGVPQNSTLVMNKNLSTPYDCAMHLGETITNRSAVALVNGDTLWHMHKPLLDSCNLELLHYNIPQPSAVNKAYWRTCSFVLGAIINTAFKDNIEVHLHSFPSPNVRSGSFVYDVQLPLDEWIPTKNELRVLSIEMLKFCQQSHLIKCLEVTPDFALLMFKNNPHKTKQIPNIANSSGGKVTLFKVGHHIDISRGPMITNTDHIARVTITNVLKLDTDISEGPIYRFQGVSLPRGIMLNHVAFGILEDRARKLNPGRIPSLHGNIEEEIGFNKQAVA